eukprot:COSAG05_NODE_12733_length_456_cov_6.686275_1_plen_28_part_10
MYMYCCCVPLGTYTQPYMYNVVYVRGGG